MPEQGAQAHTARRDWPKISDYALIGDCRTAALVGKDGGIDWWCLPHFSGPAFFARLLDRDNGGRFTIGPRHSYTSKHSYISETNVLQTTFTINDEDCGDGELRLTDTMTIPSALDNDQLMPQRELLRCIEAVNGDVWVDIVYAPRPDYGRARVRLSRCGKVGWACVHRDHLLLLHTDVPLELSEDRRCLRGKITLHAGEKRFFSAAYVRSDVGIVLPLGEAALCRLNATVKWWQAWSSRCDYHGPYRTAVMRSALTTKLLTYCLSGAVVAAPTASLPETIGGSRNWDYRYCWLRDASLTLEAFIGLGYREEADSFLGWLLHATALTRPKLQVLYDVHGEARVPESTLDHLEGYRGSRPVRIGNAAWNQHQLDAYGSVVMAAASYVMRGGRISRDSQRMLVRLGKTVCREWRQADHGIWEIRSEERHHTHSKVTCWAALDCLLQLAEQDVLSVPGPLFRRERDAIRDAIEADGFNHDINSYSGVFNSRMADASLLLIPRFRYLKGNDPRMIGTLKYLDQKLGSGALMYRYRHGFDRLPGSEQPFGICSFWAVEALARAGRTDEARARFEQLLSYANDVGLYGEEIDAVTGEAIGNFPQAFTHVGLIDAALSLAAAAEREQGVRQA